MIKMMNTHTHTLSNNIPVWTVHEYFEMCLITCIVEVQVMGSPYCKIGDYEQIVKHIQRRYTHGHTHTYHIHLGITIFQSQTYIRTAITQAQDLLKTLDRPVRKNWISSNCYHGDQSLNLYWVEVLAL